MTVDPDFTPSERTLIENAALLLSDETGGRIRVFVDYGIKPAIWTLTRLTGDSDHTALLDMQFGHSVLGVCDRTNHELFLVTPRLETETEFTHTAMHEFAHAIGMEHVYNPAALMSPGANEGSGVLLTTDDKLEMCRVIRCTP